MSRNSASRNDCVERHRDMAAAHQQRARDHRVAPSDEAVRDPAADQRREIDEAGVEAVGLRRERQRAHRPEHAFERAAITGEARDVADMPGHEQRLAHIEHQQRRHAVIGKPLPRFREGKKAQRRWLAEECPPVRALRLSGRGLFQNRHECPARFPAGTLSRLTARTTALPNIAAGWLCSAVLPSIAALSAPPSTPSRALRRGRCRNGRHSDLHYR